MFLKSSGDIFRKIFFAFGQKIPFLLLSSRPIKPKCFFSVFHCSEESGVQFSCETSSSTKFRKGYLLSHWSRAWKGHEFEYRSDEQMNFIAILWFQIMWI
jgi:hypothetical protein